MTAAEGLSAAEVERMALLVTEIQDGLRARSRANKSRRCSRHWTAIDAEPVKPVIEAPIEPPIQVKPIDETARYRTRSSRDVVVSKTPPPI